MRVATEPPFPLSCVFAPFGRKAGIVSSTRWLSWVGENRSPI
jgi:hypothetical protein